MIRRESLQKKRTIEAMAGIMMLLLAASCHAQTPLELDSAQSSDTCTNCNENASSLQGFGDAGLSGSLIGPSLGAPELVSPSGTQNSGKLTYTWKGMGGCQNYCLIVKDIKNRVVIKQCCKCIAS